MDDEFETRTLHGGPYDGEALRWESELGLVMADTCDRGHKCLARYDSEGRFVTVECHWCQRADSDRQGSAA